MGGKKISVGILTAALAGGLISAPSANAAQYQFIGSEGTVCTVEVGAAATQGLNALAFPRVGFSGVPTCTYTRSAQAGTQAASEMSRPKRHSNCKRKRRRGTRRRGCKHKSKRAKHAARAASPRLGLSDLAEVNPGLLKLLGPGGVVDLGAQTTTGLAAGLGGYQCLLAVGADCSDQGNFTPAIPLFSYSAQYSVQLMPPAGETWTSAPPGCTTDPASSCVLSSESVTPTP